MILIVLKKSKKILFFTVFLFKKIGDCFIEKNKQNYNSGKTYVRFRFSFFIRIIFLAQILLHCTKEKSDSKVMIAVSIPAMKSFVQRLVSNSIPVVVLLPVNSSPVNFSPKIKMLKELAKSQLYFQSGLPFEMSLSNKIKSTMPNTKFILLTQFINDKNKLRSIHNHGKNNPDPHIWLSPLMMKKILILMGNYLSQMYPAQKRSIQDNLQKEIDGINKTDNRVLEILNQTTQKSFLVYHPSFSYFAQYYGLNMIVIEQHGAQARHRHLIQVIKSAKKFEIKTIISQPEFSSRQLEPIRKQLQAQIVSLSPLQEDWHAMMVCLAKLISNKICK